MMPISIATIGLLAILLFKHADEHTKKPSEMSINEIMVQAHLRPMNRGTRNNLDNKLVDGKATDVEKQRLLDLYTALSRAKPPKGDPEAWKHRTGEIVAATKAVVKGEPNAAERFVKARDCRSCHMLHRAPS